MASSAEKSATISFSCAWRQARTAAFGEAASAAPAASAKAIAVAAKPIALNAMTIPPNACSYLGPSVAKVKILQLHFLRGAEYFARMTRLSLILACLLIAAPAAAGPQASAPDLTGLWTSTSLTELERPKGFTS